LYERATGEAIDAQALAAHSDADLHALARRSGLGSIVITLGAQGCFVSHADATRWGDGQPHYRIAPAAVQAGDSTGAGDAFSGALVASLVRFDARPLREAVLHANRSAAMSTETVGTAPAMPRAEDVARRFGSTPPPAAGARCAD